MAPSRDESFFRPPVETYGIFDDYDEPDDESSQTASLQASRETSQDQDVGSLLSDGEKTATIPTSGGKADKENQDADFFADFLQNKPTKAKATPAATSQKSKYKAPSSLDPLTSGNRPASFVQEQEKPKFSFNISRSTHISDPSTHKKPETWTPNMTSTASVPSYTELHAPQIVSKKRKAAERPTTGGKTVPKAKKPRGGPKKGTEIAPPVTESKSTRATTGGKSFHPIMGGKTIHPALLAPLDELETDDEDSNSTSSTSDSEEAPEEVPEEIDAKPVQGPKLEPKEGSEDTYWLYVVVQNDNRPQGVPGRKILGTYTDKQKAITHVLKRIQRLQKETGGDQFEVRSSFGPEGLVKQVVDSEGYGEIEVEIEKELVEGAIPENRVEPTNTWLPRFVYLTMVQTKDLETGAVVRTDVHEKIYTTPALANRHAIDVWRLGRMTNEEIQNRNLRAGTMIGDDAEGWVVKRLDELEMHKGLFAETYQLPLEEGPKEQEISIKVYKHEVAGPRN